MKTDITWTDTAWEHFRAVESDICKIGAYYGEQIAAEHTAEFLRAFTRVTLAAGPVNVQQDGDGFYITTRYIVIGLVWTPDTDEKLIKRLCAANGHNWLEAEIRPDWPRTGHWSAHS